VMRNQTQGPIATTSGHQEPTTHSDDSTTTSIPTLGVFVDSLIPTPLPPIHCSSPKFDLDLFGDDMPSLLNEEDDAASLVVDHNDLDLVDFPF
jgi:hypothetical protein